jgi:hypothetical protein
MEKCGTTRTCFPVLLVSYAHHTFQGYTNAIQRTEDGDGNIISPFI